MAIGASIGWDVDLVIWKESVEAQLVDLYFPLWEVKDPPVRTLSLSPLTASFPAGVPTQFTAVWDDNSKTPVTWALQGAVTNDTVSSTGLVTLSSPPGRDLILVATSADSTFATADIHVGKPFLPVTSLTAKQETATTTVHLNWTAPAITGDGPINSYLVDTDPPTVRHTLDAATTSLDLPDPAVGSTYTYSVRARNSLGKLSPPAEVSVRIRPPCAQQWTGAVSTAWNVAGNWSRGSVPTAADWVCIHTGGTSTLSTTATVLGITVESGARLNVTGSLVATSYLGLEGTLAGPGSVTISSHATGELADGEMLGRAHMINLGQVAIDAQFTVGDGSTLDNRALLTLRDGDILAGAIATGRILNATAGTITGSFTIGVPVVGGGHVATAGQSIRFADGAELSTPLIVAGGGDLTIEGTLKLATSLTLADGSDLAIAGPFTEATAAATITGIGTVTIVGTLTGSGTLDVAVPLHLRTPSISGLTRLVARSTIDVDTSLYIQDGAVTMLGDLTLHDPVYLGGAPSSPPRPAPIWRMKVASAPAFCWQPAPGGSTPEPPPCTTPSPSPP